MKNITFNYSNSFLKKHEIENSRRSVLEAHKMLHNKTGSGSDFLGWIDYPISYDKKEFERIKEAACRIRNNSQVFIVIGIGGSYLGARSAIEALSHSFYNVLSQDKRQGPEIYFVGNNISGTYLKHLLDVIEGKEVSINVISKSGTTTEPAIAFRILKTYIEEKYGKEGAKQRIFVTTDKIKGALKELVNKEGYEAFIIPDDIGGRFSIFTPVGMLPMAVAGLDIDNIMEGAKIGREEYMEEDLYKNPCYQYAAIRNVLYNRGKIIEVLVNYEPSLHYMSEWWKQLYGESEGKDGKGIFPAAVDFSTDLHSMGQYLQDGRRHIFETVLNIENPREDIKITDDEANIDNLNYLSGKSMDFVNKKAFEGTLLAHVDGGVPNLIINIPTMNEYYFGKLIYFFKKACGISGYLLGVNPFDQPGVESYKKNMFALLGKPGFEKLRKELMKRI
ncbi:glucose-6-phosphate isomerase [Paramaledivibacter caminithermalis]|uniref:Glucose-6-phosphate isomerase n=1 Tax=Paramaledivibacter caminithermalis (strain DSM 15212 / CIP 107654 / DViRD3) TaxID=1121301 RepID=A0A1M6R932_PARC5|nr:glucose-6-phosphate isomerase [Paramaledivibacter caminithermalis]SHK28807.1 glucose-6-phosphate isomerase [Paramaledivibacter caminithermalis DSM 15212]